MKNSIHKSALETKKIMRFNVLLSELYRYNKDEVKTTMLEGYDVTTTKALTPAQLDECIAGLEREKSQRNATVEKPIRIKCSQCLELLTKIGLDTTDWSKINKYLEQPRLLNGKRMYDLDLDGLEALRKKLYAIHAVVDKRIEDEKFWATNN